MGYLTIQFEAFPIMKCTPFSPSLPGFEEVYDPSQDEAKYLGSLRLLNLSVCNIPAVYKLFSNSLRVFVSIDKLFSMSTTVAREAGDRYSWDLVEWPVIDLFQFARQMPANIRLVIKSNNETIGWCEMSYEQIERFVFTTTEVVDLCNSFVNSEGEYRGDVALSCLHSHQKSAFPSPAKVPPSHEEAIFEENEILPDLKGVSLFIVKCIVRDVVGQGDGISNSIRVAFLYDGFRNESDLCTLPSPSSLATWVFPRTQEWKFKALETDQTGPTSVPSSCKALRVDVLSNAQLLGYSIISLQDVLRLNRDGNNMVSLKATIETYCTDMLHVDKRGTIVLTLQVVDEALQETDISLKSDGQGHFNTSTSIIVDETSQSRRSLPLGSSLPAASPKQLPHPFRPKLPYLVTLPMSIAIVQIIMDDDKHSLHSLPTHTLRLIVSVRSRGNHVLNQQHSFACSEKQQSRYFWNMLLCSLDIFDHNVELFIQLQSRQMGRGIVGEVAWTAADLLQSRRSAHGCIDIFSDLVHRRQRKVVGRLRCRLLLSSTSSKQSISNLLARNRFHLPVSIRHLADDSQSNNQQGEIQLHLLSITDLSVFYPKIAVVVTSNDYLEYQPLARNVSGSVVINTSHWPSIVLNSPSKSLTITLFKLHPRLEQEEEQEQEVEEQDDETFIGQDGNRKIVLKYQDRIGSATLFASRFLDAAAITTSNMATTSPTHRVAGHQQVPQGEEEEEDGDGIEMVTLFGDIVFGVTPIAKFSLAFELLSSEKNNSKHKIKSAGDDGGVRGSPQQQNRHQTLVTDSSSDRHMFAIPKRLKEGHPFMVEELYLHDLPSVHRFGKNSPSFTLSYVGQTYSSPSLPYAGSSATWREIHYVIHCHNRFSITLAVTSASVLIGQAIINISDLLLMEAVDGRLIIKRSLAKKNGQGSSGSMEMVLRLMSKFESEDYPEAEEEEKGSSPATAAVLTSMSPVGVKERYKIVPYNKREKMKMKQMLQDNIDDYSSTNTSIASASSTFASLTSFQQQQQQRQRQQLQHDDVDVDSRDDEEEDPFPLGSARSSSSSSSFSSSYPSNTYGNDDDNVTYSTSATSATYSTYSTYSTYTSTGADSTSTFDRPKTSRGGDSTQNSVTSFADSNHYPTTIFSGHEGGAGGGGGNINSNSPHRVSWASQSSHDYPPSITEGEEEEEEGCATPRSEVTFDSSFNNEENDNMIPYKPPSSSSFTGYDRIVLWTAAHWVSHLLHSVVASFVAAEAVGSTGGDYLPHHHHHHNNNNYDNDYHIDYHNDNSDAINNNKMMTEMMSLSLTWSLRTNINNINNKGNININDKGNININNKGNKEKEKEKLIFLLAVKAVEEQLATGMRRVLNRQLGGGG
eukprot:scaffold8581_cov181-Ochromonas_danica.AAC.1